jgi:hypothetical protein
VVNHVAYGARTPMPLDYRIDIFRVTKGGHFGHL